MESRTERRPEWSDSDESGAPPISIPEYGAKLTNSLNPLDTALRDLNKAKAYKGLAKRVTAVENATGPAAVMLGNVKPPTEVATEHQQLVTALRQFKAAIGGVNLDVDGKGVCTGAAARSSLSDATKTLRTATKALSTKLPEGQLSLTLPDTSPKNLGRLSNGHYVRSGSRDGRGTLTIDNGGDHDAVVTLAKSGKPTVSVYVRKDKKYTVSGVNDGTYRIYFTGGNAWDRAAQAFGKHCSFEKFDDTLKFSTVRTTTQIRWSTWKITLQPVAGGTASTSDVDPDSFPTS